jgi:hypothetical protein
MGCNICHQKVCCCEKRISVKGKKGDPGQKGVGQQGIPGIPGVPGDSTYMYIGYADNVVAGSPDVVTGFSLTTPKCWMAVITSNTPLLPPVEADFQGQWFDRCCECESGGDGINVFTDPAQTIVSGSPGVAITGLNTAPLAAGTYLFWADINVIMGINSVVNLQYRVNGIGIGSNPRLYISASADTVSAFISGKIVVPAAGVVDVLVSCNVANVLIYAANMNYIKIA